MANSISPFGQSYFGQSVFGQASNADTTSPSSVSFGTAIGAFQVNTPVFSSTPTSGTSASSIPGASGLFGASSVSGQNSTSTSNVSAFGSQLGGPKFDGTSNNFFGTNSGSKPLFGTTASAGFSVSSGPSFGSTSPNFGSNSLFGTTASTGFGGSLASFGVSSRPSFGSTSPNSGPNLVFGVSSTPSFASSSSNIGSNSVFGVSSTPSFASSSSNIGSNSVFGVSSTPSFASSSANIGSNSVFGVSSTPSFASSSSNIGSNSVFGVSSTPSFVSSSANIGSNSIFGPFSRPSFESSFANIGSNSIFGPSRPSLESNSSNIRSNFLFGPSSRPSLGSSSSNVGSNSIFGPSFRPSFGSFSSNSALDSLFGANQRKGSRIEPYSATSSIEDRNLKVQSLLAMGVYQDKSHEELRLEDYNAGDRGQMLTFTLPSQDQSSVTTFPSFSSSALYTGRFPATQTPSFTFTPQTPNNSFAPQIPSTFPTIPNQTTPGFLFPQVPSTTCPPTTSPITFPAPVGNAVSTNNASAGAQIPSLSTPLDSVQTFQTTNVQSSSAVVGPSTSIQGPASQSTADQPAVKASPFGELPAISRLPVSQYGISSMPVKDKPSAPVRLSSLLTSRHLSHHRIRLPARKYDSKSEGPKVPFFNKDEEGLCVRASTLVPRENPRAFVVHSAEVWPHRSETEEISSNLNVSLHGNGEGESSENNTKKEEPSNGLNKDPYEIDDSHEAKNFKEDKIEALMPQLSLPGYYTEPSITQLAKKEKAEPGFCSRVIDFEIGRCGYGNIKFFGETDVRNLSLDSLVEFNAREVIVYKNEDERPPVGKGLNKQAEVTLLNIDCVDKNTGKKYVDGPKVDKYKEMLIKKGEKQGVEFISFDPVIGEWKFKVQHF